MRKREKKRPRQQILLCHRGHCQEPFLGGLQFQLDFFDFSFSHVRRKDAALTLQVKLLKPIADSLTRNAIDFADSDIAVRFDKLFKSFLRRPETVRLGFGDLELKLGEIIDKLFISLVSGFPAFCQQFFVQAQQRWITTRRARPTCW